MKLLLIDSDRRANDILSFTIVHNTDALKNLRENRRVPIACR